MFLIGTKGLKVQRQIGNWRRFREDILATLSQKETNTGVAVAAMWRIGSRSGPKWLKLGKFCPRPRQKSLAVLCVSKLFAEEAEADAAGCALDDCEE